MATVAPPPYAGGNPANTADIKAPSAEIANLSKLSSEAKADTVAILNHPDNQKLIKASIDNLCTQTQQSRQAFEDISILLNLFDGRKFKTKTNEDIEPLFPAWDDLCKRYNALLDQSKLDAICIKAICEDYKANILTLLTEDDLILKMKDVREEVSGFKKRTEKAAKVAKGNADSFDKLRVDVRLCKAKIDAAFSDAAADPTGRGPVLEQEIKELKKKIDEAQKYIDDCLLVLKASGVLTGVGGVLCAFCPFAAILVAGAAFAAAGAKIASDKKQKELDGYKTSLATKQKELAAIAEREQILQNLREQLANDQSNFTTIINQLTALSTFWQATSGDLESLTIYLQTGETEDTTLRTFKKTLGQKLAGNIYETLAEVLGKYISQMAKLEEEK
ncbi:hypothetical protein C8R43DRAFT_967231 [Mycena crocata]|nr:hypothetical protein C8R43DRAFT_967231 [Mycena crocata]